MSENSSLFRKESFEARRMTWLGRPAVLQNIPTIVLAVTSLVIVVAIIAFLIFGDYTRRVSVSGVMLPTEGLTRVSAPSYGWVTRQHVKKGESVGKGDVLYEINLESTTALGDTQEVVNQLLRDQREEIKSEIKRHEKLAVQEKNALRNQQDNLVGEIEQIEEQIKVSEEFSDTLHGYAMEQKEYMDKGLTPSQAFESRLQAYMERRETLERLKGQHVRLRSELENIRDELSSFDLSSASEVGRLRRQLIDIEKQVAEGESRQSIRVTAPRDGIVESISTQAGQTVSTGTPLLTILPDDAQLKAQMLVPNRDIGFLHESDGVLLRYSAFPYQKFGQYPGTVSGISRAPLKQDEIKMLVDNGASAPSSTAVYRITVKPDSPFAITYGDRVPLQAGMQVEAHIMVETRPIYQWIFEPLYGLAEVLDAEGEAQ
ncbi:HlyD family efflux transporter periplasmic adaptor subunit [Halomonas eurihalina]|uniref:HlyD family efflux transporter periplasmic adaptor subunit n=1 Tax=Halomonas eurihalina TaxID=42566 RepID=A0A5D9DCV3_HALER|nr:HlyD family efflux transporter periplasmic adaptor subunit [Halomonas eurihalina]MDR5858104.1 HlyD family efflux transporter periplasmic adaptor subunit [Halomonas eurihalina]TZG41389.1 HlyD family efflux transporter periplasmic adaptor subunit [Halomonas eurihalina]